ncbi:MAG: nucleotidyl transferase AbiEii/AbiGii toxin family protein [Anaerolineae bacterium]|nr:nucleotidyl transferase AbiEii/AbiGii toxin family protein [Anaerolineae bacterium]
MFVETLPPDTRHLLERLGQLSAVAPFYLAGGSAIALHLGHRISVDLDFFTFQSDYETEPLIQQLQSVGNLVIRQQSRGTLNATLAGTLISFFVYPYPLLEETRAAWNIRVAGLLDLALMKLAAIGQRGAKRDFVDLYQICHHGYKLDDLLRCMPDKFPKVTYPSYHLLRALAYFEDAEAEPMPPMLIPLEWPTVRRFFEDEVRRLMHALLGPL